MIAKNYVTSSWPSVLAHPCKTPPTSVPNMRLNKSDGEALVMLEHWGTRSTPLLPLHSGPLWPGVVAPNTVILMG